MIADSTMALCSSDNFLGLEDWAEEITISSSLIIQTFLYLAPGSEREDSETNSPSPKFNKGSMMPSSQASMLRSGTPTSGSKAVNMTQLSSFGTEMEE